MLFQKCILNDTVVVNISFVGLSCGLIEGIIFSFQRTFDLVFLFMYIFQLSFSSRSIPRYFIELSLLFVDLNQGWICVFFRVKILVLFLVVFGVSIHLKNHRDNSSSEFFRSFIEDSRILFCVVIAVSFTNIASQLAILWSCYVGAVNIEYGWFYNRSLRDTYFNLFYL